MKVALKLSRKSIALLKNIAKSVEADPAKPYHLATDDEMKELVDHKLVAINREIFTGDTPAKFAVILNDAGKAELAERSTPAAPKAPIDPSTFQRARIAAIPERKRGGAVRVSAYAEIDNLEAPDSKLGFDSILIVPTKDRPTPAKTLNSTVSGFSKKYKKLNETDPTNHPVAREFVLVPEAISGNEFGDTAARVVRKV